MCTWIVFNCKEIIMKSIESYLKKIVDWTGIFYPITSTIKTLTDGHNQLITMKQEYDVQLKRKILDNASLNDIEKSILISNIHKSTIEFVNKARILDSAITNVDLQKQVYEPDQDWVLYFFDQAKNISDEQMQSVWGKVFALYLEGKLNNNRKIVNALALLEQKDIDCFCSLCSMTFNNLSNQSSFYPFIYIVDSPSYYNNYNIRRFNLKQLDYLGLIEYDNNSNFVLPTTVPKLQYGKNTVELSHVDRVSNGNVRFTEIGQSLYNITDVSELDDFIEHCKFVWKKKGIRYKITS